MINGVLNIYKEPGYTSHDVVARLRGILRQKKIGHTGTLDPDAEGVLPVCLGKATRLCGMLTEERKTYEAVLLLGITTDTQDAGGTEVSRHPVECSEEEAVRCLESFRGEGMQIPPMYSALKKNGKKLYELARQGLEIEREARPVHFYEITILRVELPRITFRVTCSRGTYIRTLCHDAGQKLGCGGCMERLIRTRVGRFAREDAKTLDQIEELAAQGRLSACLLPVDRVFADLPACSCRKEADQAARNGNPLNGEQIAGKPEGETEHIRLYDSEGNFIGLYRKDRNRGIFRPEKMFYDETQAGN
jgi:tRNA pseudouridine55 synthase